MDFNYSYFNKNKIQLSRFAIVKLSCCTYVAAESILAPCYIIFAFSITILVSKLIKIRALLAILLFVLAFSTKANELIILKDDSSSVNISSTLSVYPQQGRALSFDEFKLARTNLSYQNYKNPNYGYNPSGIWLYGEVKNLSKAEDWIFNVNFSQLDQVDLYVVGSGKIIEKVSGGREQSGHSYRTPTFKVRLDYEKTYQVYIFVKAKRIPIIAPVRLMSEYQHEHETLLDYLIWGGFYGGLLVIALYCVAIVYDKRELSAIVLFILVCLVFLWQMIWSGHVQLLPDEWHSRNFFHNLDALLPLVCAAGTLFTLTFLPRPKSFSLAHVALQALFVVLLLIFATMQMGLLNDVVLLLLTRFIGFTTIVLNVIYIVKSINQKFLPAKTIFVGWVFLATGSIIGTLFIGGKLPINSFTTYVFQSGLLAQTLCFVLAIILKVRYKLELEIHQASQDAENNFLLIEEQNVHLDIARREAVKASEIKSQFLANMSHEIRTPLNAIIGFSKELESKKSETERDEHVRIINSAASDLLTIVNDILDFSKMEAGKLTINQKPFSPRDAFEEIVSSMAKSAHLKQLEFIFDIDTLPAVLIGDSFKLKQLMSNLLSNALKFTNDGQITLRARSLQFGNDEYMLSVEVEDTGIGISDADKKKLFKPFNQLDDDLNRSFQGTGLGLVICQELTFLMKGSIEVESHYSLGSKFTINLPFKTVNNQYVPAVQSRFYEKTAGIYDPIPENRKNTVKLLKALGFVTYSYDSISAFEQTEHSFDYIFASLPMRRLSKRSAEINRILKMNSQKIVFLFSGPPPEEHQIRRVVNQPFIIRSPLTLKNINDLNTVAIEAAEKGGKSGVKSLPPARILAVDDMPLNLKLLDTWLKESPITLDTATSGADSVELCKHNEYDLILMDIQMPNMDGLQATKLIRQTDFNLGTPIIAITAHAFPEERDRFLSSGMDDYLPKPVDLETLVKTIQNWCSGTEFIEAKSVPINWEAAVKKANGNEEGAKEFLAEFVLMLPQSMSEIELHWQMQDFESLQECVHKLHGVSAYTGATNFQKICYETESHLKRQQYTDLKKLFSNLLVEAESIIEHWHNVVQFEPKLKDASDTLN